VLNDLVKAVDYVVTTGALVVGPVELKRQELLTLAVAAKNVVGFDLQYDGMLWPDTSEKEICDKRRKLMEAQENSGGLHQGTILRRLLAHGVIESFKLGVTSKDGHLYTQYVLLLASEVARLRATAAVCMLPGCCKTGTRRTTLEDGTEMVLCEQHHGAMETDLRNRSFIKGTMDFRLVVGQQKAC
jgi:hypothetical protein